MTESFPADAAELAAIRAHIRERAEAAGLPEALSDDLVLAVSEASANAIMHSGAPAVHLTWTDLPDGVQVEIADDGQFLNRVPMPELDGVGGHGIQLMTSLVDDIQISEGTPDRPGTVVRLILYRRRLAG